MRSFAAHYICSGPGILMAKQAICLDDEGCVCAVQPFRDERASTVFLNGVICPAFGLPGGNQLLTTDEATSLIRRVKNADSSIVVTDFLEFYTNLSALKIGLRPVLWCIEPLDLKNLLLLDGSSVYSVFP